MRFCWWAPFAPPQARIADPLETRALAPARKPAAVWLIQALGVVAIVWWCAWLAEPDTRSA